MNRKWFPCDKKGMQDLEKEYPNCKQILTVSGIGGLYITCGDDITEEEVQVLNSIGGGRITPGNNEIDFERSEKSKEQKKK